jgi:hypothetical protein
MATKKILLTRTAVVKGKHYLPDPDKIHEFDADIVDELVDKNAGEPVLDLSCSRLEEEPETIDQEPEASVPGPKKTHKKKHR